MDVLWGPAMEHHPSIHCDRRSGVLEQSWRVGGASPAEIMAFETFKNEPGREFLRVCCVERYGEDVEIPETGQVYYQGVDEHTGPLTKYALVLS